MKLLVVHHSRDLKSDHIYINDDYLLANNTLYGAQEMDTWAGIRLFAKKHSVWRLQVCPNYNSLRLIDPLGNLVQQIFIPPSSRLGKVKDLGFLRSLFIWTDTSIALYGTTSFRNGFRKILGDYSFDKIWVGTQFYEAAIPSSVPHLIRTVNFEPYHAFTESRGLPRYLRALTRLISERRVFRRNIGFAISPLDHGRYLRIGIRQMGMIPLRQLAFISQLTVSPINSRKTFLIIGSTYEVLHNRRNLLFLLNELAPQIRKYDPEIRFQIFGNRLPEGLKIPHNCEYLGFDPDLQARIIGSTGVIVPFHGGAGMQSKIFEPLCLGSAVIANPKSLVGYPYIANEHYIAATNLHEYVEAILILTSDSERAKSISLSARKKSQELFTEPAFVEKIDKAIQE